MAAIEDPLKLNKTTVTTTEANTPLPNVVGVDYTPDRSPFQYQEGATIADILEQGRRHQATLKDQQLRAERSGKFNALNEFFTSLAGLTGGGYAPIQRSQPSPYLQRAFNDVEQSINAQHQADIHYNNLYQKARQEDYNTQLKSYLDKMAAQDKNLFDVSKINAATANDINRDEYKANTTRTTDEYIDPTEANRRHAIELERLAHQREVEAGRAARGAATSKPFLEYRDPVTGNVSTMTISQAQQVVNDVASRYPGIVDRGSKDINSLNAEERAIYNDLSNIMRSMASGDIEAQNNAIRATALKYLGLDTENKYGPLYLEGARATTGGRLIDNLSGNNPDVPLFFQ